MTSVYAPFEAAVVRLTQRGVVLGAMKMEHTVEATDGDVAVTHAVAEGDTVGRGQLLFVAKPLFDTNITTITNNNSTSITNTRSSVSSSSSNSNSDGNAENAAHRRLEVVGSHVLHSLEAMAERRAEAAKHGGAKGVARARRAGKKLARERIALLLDEGSFVEVGSLAGSAETEAKSGRLLKFHPRNVVVGTGRISGRPLVVAADDFTVGGGHTLDMSEMLLSKHEWAERECLKLRIPLVRLLDGSSSGGSVKTILSSGASYIPPICGFDLMTEQLRTVPVVAVLLGSVVGLGAAKAQFAHYSVMVPSVAQLFVAGPPLVNAAFGTSVSKEELGGAAVVGESVDDVEASSEADACARVRRFLSFLPLRVGGAVPKPESWEAPTPEEREALLALIPAARNESWPWRAAVDGVVDRESWFEIGAHYGQEMRVGLARIEGHIVGLLVSDSMTATGAALTTLSCRKLRRHVELCSTFGIPLVSLIDVPGFAIGLQHEKAANIRYGADFIQAFTQSQSQHLCIIVRRCFGVGGAALANLPPQRCSRLAWPTGLWGSLPLEGGVRAAFKRKLDAIGDEKRRKEAEEKINAQLEALSDPLLTAQKFGVEELMDPRHTRERVAQWLAVLNSK